MTDEEGLNAYQSMLSSVMSDVSEANWCASWLVGLEYILWDWLHNSPERLTEVEAYLLSSVSDKAGGWIMWSEEEGGRVFVPMSEWLVLYDKHVSEFEMRNKR